jgi:K+-sensing histidine kinase KdpD/CheY-like chemotaxis protein
MVSVMFPLKPTILRYAIAVLGSLLAVAVSTAPIDALSSRYPLLPFFAAVTMASWFGGLGPGLLATAVSTLALGWFILRPLDAGVGDASDILALGLFAAIGALVGGLCHGLHQARHRTQDTERRERAARSEAEAAQRRTALLAEASATLAASLDYEATLQRVAGLAVPGIADWCVIDLVDETGFIRRLAVVHADPSKAEWAEQLRQSYRPDGGAATGVERVLSTGKTDLVPEIAEERPAAGCHDPEHHDLLRRFGVRAGMVVPLVAHGRTIGAISLYTADSGRRYDVRDVVLAEELARRAAVAIENATLYREAEQRRREAERRRREAEELAHVARVLTETAPDVSAVGQAIVERVLRLVDAETCAFRLFRSDGTLEMVAIAGAARGSFEPGDVLPAGAGIVGQAAAERRVIATPDALTAPGVTLPDKLRRRMSESGSSAVLAVPLDVQGTIIGILSLTNRTGHVYGEVETNLVRAFADQVAGAVERARLHEQTELRRRDAERAAQRAQLLADASRVLSSSVDEAAMLGDLAAVLVPSLADWLTVHLARADGSIQRITPRYADPARQALADALARAESHVDWRTAKTPLMDVIKSGEPLLVSAIGPDLLDAIPGERYRGLIAERLAPTSVMIVPLVARGVTLGAMTFASTDAARRYDRSDLVFARDLAGRAALALDNARLLRRSERAASEAQRASRTKDEFLAMLAHELRNPIGVVVNALAILDRVGGHGDLADRSRMIIHRQTEQLSRLVDDLLDVARVTTGKITLALEPLDLGAIVQQCIGTLREAGRLERHRVEVDVDHIWTRADRTRIEQVVTNLLTNSVKYTPPGGLIRVRVRAEGEQVVVRVEDSGIGIPPALLPRVFDLFTQGERGLDRGSGGLGIGLTLVRRLVEQHGGAVEAYSDGPGCGSTFVVRLPIGPSPPADAAAGHVDRPAPEPLRILVVEDNVDARETLRTVLGMLGHEVHEADDGPTGLAMALDVRPDLALIDIGLPGLDGYEVAQRLRTEAPEIRLIALTGYGQEEDRRRALDAGFDTHLVKPVSPDRLLRALEGTAA